MAQVFVPYDVINTETGERRTVKAREQADLDAGSIVTLDPWEVLETPPDGFRERKRRGKGWYKAAVADGTIADPDNPAERHPVFGPGTKVFDVPLMTIEGQGHEVILGGGE